MKKLVLIALTAIAVISVVGVVSAQQTTPPVPEQTQPSTAGIAGQASILRELLQIVAGDLNLQPQDILQQMRGQTLADVIKANNGDVTRIGADITAAVTARVNQAVTDGQMTQQRADQILGSLDTVVQNALQGNGLGRGRGIGPMFGQQRPGLRGVRPNILNMDVRPLLSAIESATKLTPQQIAQQIRSGQTLSAIITTNGGDPAAVESAAIATATQKLDTIRQNGTLSQDQETAMLDGLKAFYDAVLNGAFHQPAVQTTSTQAPI